jgi:hypothetical protein
MKQRIINAIKSDGELKKTLEILNANHMGVILRRYEELLLKKTGRRIESEYILKKAFIESPGNIKCGLQVWVKSDLWNYVKGEIGKQPDELEFSLSLHEALDELQLSRALAGVESIYRQTPPPKPLPISAIEKIKPRTMQQRW